MVGYLSAHGPAEANELLLGVPMGRQSDAPFKFLVRPVTTVNALSKKLSWAFEDELFSSLRSVRFSSPVTGILILPGIIDRSIAPPPSDSFKHHKEDNSVSVGNNLDFEEWQRSSEMERLELLTQNIHSSLDRIKNSYLFDEDRRILHELVDETRDRLAFMLKTPLI
jgi:hypothetical protein